MAQRNKRRSQKKKQERKSPPGVGVPSLSSIMSEQASLRAQAESEHRALREENLWSEVPNEVLLESLRMAQEEEELRRRRERQERDRERAAAEAETRAREEDERRRKGGPSESGGDLAAQLQAAQDLALAAALQRGEVSAMARRRRAERGSKVQSASPRVTVQFPYEDGSLVLGDFGDFSGNVGLGAFGVEAPNHAEKDSREVVRSAEEEEEEEEEEEVTASDMVTRHDPEEWRRRHVERLNQYENMGDLPADTSFHHQAYNAFRNELAKKGFTRDAAVVKRT